MIGTSVIEGYVHNPQIEHTPAYKMCHYLFLCEVAAMHLMTNEYMAASGTITTGDPALDRQMAIQPQQCQLTVAGMAEMLSEGVTITLVVPEDSLRIYQIIYDHLTNWQRTLTDQPSYPDPPLEDLDKLDRLAAEVYKVARYHWKEEPYHGRLQQFLAGKSRQRMRIYRHTEAKTEHAPEHTPMADTIRDTVRRHAKPWKER